MLINVVSDLHLTVAPLAIPGNDADVVVLAGDIARPREAIAWASRIAKPVFYVAGNHEFYGRSIAGTIAELKTLCAGSSIRFLDCDEVTLDGVRFLGTTLWTDFMLLGEGERRADAMAQARRFMRDFSTIRLAEGDEAPFTPAQSAALFRRHAAWLEARLSVPHDGPTVVVTHHAPSPRSIHPRFAASPLNACFVSDAEYLMDARRVALWIHGHTHDSFDYAVNGTRVLCNPRGYAKGGVNENALFDPDLAVELLSHA